MNWVKNGLDVEKPKDASCTVIWRKATGSWVIAWWDTTAKFWQEILRGEVILDNEVTHFAVITEPDDAS